MFIELYNIQTKSTFLVNKNHIVDVQRSNNGCVIHTLISGQANCLFVKESYEEIKTKLMGYTPTASQYDDLP